jgi:hypothetical protein
MAVAFSAIYTIEDGKTKTSTCEINFPSSVTLANASIFAAEMAKLINAVTTGAIRRIGLAFTVPLPGTIRTTPASASDVEEGAKFQFKTDGGWFTGFRIPTFSDTLMATGTGNVDLTDTAVAALVTALTDGINLVGAGGTGTIAPTDKREDDIDVLSFAREQFISSRGA